MPWQPVLGTQPLAPFDHQVAGQSSMLRYDKTTVCKPLIAREHFVYKTLPLELAEFTPEYRGEIEVQLIEEDGYIQLYGLSVDDEVSDDQCACTSESDSHEHMSPKAISREASFKNRRTVRLLRSGSYEVCPTTSEVFYAVDSNPDSPHTHSLNPWSLKNHKRLLDKMRKSEHTHDKIRFILLKNVVADFRHPCILDLKIGSRLHGDDASSVKAASQSEKCKQTTSSTLRVRLCGMQVYQVDSGAYHSVDKYHGRTLTDESFKDMLYKFLHNGAQFRSELIRPVVSRLSELIKCLENLDSFRFYASSLLIIYDGDISVPGERTEASRGVASSSDSLGLKGVDNLPYGSKDLNRHEDFSSRIIEHIKDNSLLDDSREYKGGILSGESSEPKRVDNLSDQSKDSKEDGVLPGTKETKGKIIITAGNYRHGSATSNVSLSADLEYITDRLVSSKGISQPLNSTAHQHYHSSQEHVRPVKKQSVTICSDSHLISSPAPVQNVIQSQCDKRQMKSEMDSGEIVTGLLARVVDVKTEEDSPSVPSVNHLNVDALSQGVTGTLLQKRSVENNISHGEISCQCLSLNKVCKDPRADNHLSQVPVTAGLSSCDVGNRTVCLNEVSLTESQTVHLAEQQQTLKTDSTIAGVAVIQPSIVPSLNLTQKDSIIYNHGSSLVASKTPENINNLEVISPSDAISDHTQEPQSVSFVKSKFHEHTSTVEKPTLLDHYSKTAVTSHTGEASTLGNTVTNILPESQNCVENVVKVDVKMIDFAHTTHRGFVNDKIKHTGPDIDYIVGLRNLMMLFQELQGRD